MGVISMKRVILVGLMAVASRVQTADQEQPLVWVSPQNDGSVTIDSDGQLFLYHTGRAVYSARDAQNAAYNSDGTKLLVERSDGTYFEVLNTVSGDLIDDYTFGTPMQFVAWARDEVQEFVILVDVKTGRLWRYNIGVGVRLLRAEEERLLRLESNLY